MGDETEAFLDKALEREYNKDVMEAANTGWENFEEESCASESVVKMEIATETDEEVVAEIDLKVNSVDLRVEEEEVSPQIFDSTFSKATKDYSKHTMKNEPPGEIENVSDTNEAEES